MSDDGRREREADLQSIVGGNLRRIRRRSGLSLERLAEASGVSRAMISQIETGKSTPTINVLSKLAFALGVPFTQLMDAPQTRLVRVQRLSEAKVVASADGKVTSRALCPSDIECRAAFDEFKLAALHAEREDGHGSGTLKNAVVVRGQIEIRIADEKPVLLGIGDAILFAADVPHVYRNLSDEVAVLYIVTYHARFPL